MGKVASAQLHHGNVQGDLDTIMKLSGTIGVTQKAMTFDTHVCLILNLKTFIQQVNIGTT